MAVSELGGIAEIEGWEAPTHKPFLVRLALGLKNFARKKPLGFACGVVVVFFFVIGDVVPETANKLARTAGIADHPVPYLADQLEQAVPWLYPYAKQDLKHRLEGSSSAHLLGTDAIGRDILSRLMYGARTAVMVSFGAVLISMTIGAFIGIMSGYYGRWVDKFLWQMVIVLGVIGGPIQSRTLRGQTIYVMASPFIEAARVVGCSDRRIMLRYILPNVFALIVLNATFLLGFLVLLEATLSFLGYGLPPPFPSWGQMLSLEGRQYMRTQPGLAIYPGIAIGILVFSFNLFGDALRDVLDPRLRGSR
jgi:ABC-type dipeptide/oligopeptide/nickel transport system permease subunit